MFPVVRRWRAPVADPRRMHGPAARRGRRSTGERRVPLAEVLMILLLLFPALSAGSDRPLRIGGTGGALGAMEQVARVYRETRPDVVVEILPSLGSGGGVKALRKKALEIGLVSRPLKAEERSPELQVTPYARTPLVFAVNRECSLTDITVEEIEAIYRGAETVCPDGYRFRIIMRPRTESDTLVIRSLSAGMAEAYEKAVAVEGWPFAVTDQEVADILERTPGAFGLTTLSLLVSEGRRVKTLSFNGVTPSVETLREGAYGLSKTFSLVTAGNPSGPVKDFISFLLGPRGREVLEKNGCLPWERISSTEGP